MVPTFTIKNTGNVTLTNVVLTDDAATPGVYSDDFHPTRTGGDTNGNGKLDPANRTYSASHTVTEAEFNAGLPLVDTATVTCDQMLPNSPARRSRSNVLGG